MADDVGGALTGQAADAEEERRLRELFRRSFQGRGYPARIGDSPLGIEREFQIFDEERKKSMEPKPEVDPDKVTG